VGQEKRAHERAVTDLSVTVRCGGGAVLKGTVENLGALGALVSTPDLEAALDVGDKVTLSMPNASGGATEVEGEILRLEQEFAAGDIRRAFAVRFSEPFDPNA